MVQGAVSEGMGCVICVNIIICIVVISVERILCETALLAVTKCMFYEENSRDFIFFILVHISQWYVCLVFCIYGDIMQGGI